MVPSDILPHPPSSPSMPHSTSHPRARSSYFVRHWRGELSLGRSFWINFCLLSIVLPTAFSNGLNLLMHNISYSLRTASLASLALLLFAVTMYIWGLVGTWRSAVRHVAKGGSSRWANTARIMVAIGAFSTASTLATSIIPQVKEFALLAIGHDPLGDIDIKVSANGQAVILRGVFREGSARDVIKILDSAPTVTTLMLNSPGGRILEARKLADAIHARALNTYVEDWCASACTFVFLAGYDRAATPNARIGFHQPSFPGLDDQSKESVTQDMLNTYRSAGLPEHFMQRISETPSYDMWYPSRDELVIAHVLTRLSLGGEVATIALGMRSEEDLLLKVQDLPLYQAIEKRYQGMAKTAVSNAWEKQLRGGTDTDLRRVMNDLINELYPKLLQTADDHILEGFLALLINEMAAAQNISAEVCTLLIDGKLSVSQTLPKNIAKQEEQFLLMALTSAEMPDQKPLQIEQFRRVIRKVTSSLSQESIDVINNPKAYASRPQLVCETYIGYYQNIAALPDEERHVMLRGMFQHDAEPSAGL